MTAPEQRRPAAEVARRLTHVRWLAGGCGAGKTTLVRTLADHHDVAVYHGDLAERDYARRSTPRHHPLLWEVFQTPLAKRWIGRTAEEVFDSMPSLHGETFGFVLDDLLAMPADRPVLVDDFRTLPREVGPLLRWPGQAVFLLPTPEFRRHTLGIRYADPVRARANWGEADHAEVMEIRFGRDALWDAEVRRQAAEVGLPVLEVDGSRTPEDLARDLAVAFRLT